MSKKWSLSPDSGVEDDDFLGNNDYFLKKGLKIKNEEEHHLQIFEHLPSTSRGLRREDAPKEEERTRINNEAISGWTRAVASFSRATSRQIPVTIKKEKIDDYQTEFEKIEMQLQPKISQNNKDPNHQPNILNTLLEKSFPEYGTAKIDVDKPLSSVERKAVNVVSSCLQNEVSDQHNYAQVLTSNEETFNSYDPYLNKMCSDGAEPPAYSEMDFGTLDLPTLKDMEIHLPKHRDEVQFEDFMKHANELPLISETQSLAKEENNIQVLTTNELIVKHESDPFQQSNQSTVQHETFFSRIDSDNYTSTCELKVNPNAEPSQTVSNEHYFLNLDSHHIEGTFNQTQRYSNTPHTNDMSSSVFEFQPVPDENPQRAFTYSSPYSFIQQNSLMQEEKMIVIPRRNSECLLNGASDHNPPQTTVPKQETLTSLNNEDKEELYKDRETENCYVREPAYQLRSNKSMTSSHQLNNCVYPKRTVRETAEQTNLNSTAEPSLRSQVNQQSSRSQYVSNSNDETLRTTVSTRRNNFNTSNTTYEFASIPQLTYSHSQNSRKKELICEHCKKKYVRPQFFEKHRAGHFVVKDTESYIQKIRIYHCRNCDLYFIKNSLKHYHFNNCKFKDKQIFKCSVCAKIYIRKGFYIKHQRTHDLSL